MAPIAKARGGELGRVAGEVAHITLALTGIKDDTLVGLTRDSNSAAQVTRLPALAEDK